MRLCVAALALACLRVAAAALVWTQVSTTGSTAPTPRGGFSAGYDVVTRQLLVFGGVAPDGTVSQETWVFSVDRATWTRSNASSSAVPTRRYNAVSGLSSSARVWVVGCGNDDTGAPLNDLWALRIDTLSWQRLSPTGQPPSPRFSAAGGMDPWGGRLLFVSHGQQGKHVGVQGVLRKKHKQQTNQPARRAAIALSVMRCGVTVPVLCTGMRAGCVCLLGRDRGRAWRAGVQVSFAAPVAACTP